MGLNCQRTSIQRMALPVNRDVSHHHFVYRLYQLDNERNDKARKKRHYVAINWVLEDIDFAVDSCLLSQNHSGMQQRANDLGKNNGGFLDLKVNSTKTKEM